MANGASDDTSIKTLVMAAVTNPNWRQTPAGWSVEYQEYAIRSVQRHGERVGRADLAEIQTFQEAALVIDALAEEMRNRLRHGHLPG